MSGGEEDALTSKNTHTRHARSEKRLWVGGRGGRVPRTLRTACGNLSFPQQQHYSYDDLLFMCEKNAFMELEKTKLKTTLLREQPCVLENRNEGLGSHTDVHKLQRHFVNSDVMTH